jgi:hypothetical protein
VVPDIGGMLATLDRKVRLARGRGVARLAGQDRQPPLVLPEARTARRRIEDHEGTFRNAFPARNIEVNRWLRTPSRPLSGLLFLPITREAGIRQQSGGVARPGGTRPRTPSRDDDRGDR